MHTCMYVYMGGCIHGIYVCMYLSIYLSIYLSWFKNPQGTVPLPNQPNLFLILRIIYVFFHTKVEPCIFTYSSSFLLLNQHILLQEVLVVIFLNTAWGV